MTAPHQPRGQRPAPRPDGAWIIGETWDPFTGLPDDYRWWRRQLRPNEIVEYQITDDEAAVWVTVVQDGITRVPITPLALPRFRVTTRTPQWDALIAAPLVFIDVLTNLPPARLIPWGPLTKPGDINPPKDDPGHPWDTRRQYETDYLTVPLDQHILNRIRYGPRLTFSGPYLSVRQGRLRNPNGNQGGSD